MADLLRVATAGSVDDGKSTLIGRLLVDSRQVLEDQLASVRRPGANVDGGDDDLNLAHLTDGLRAERERGITIDVAYRYFATPQRRFVLADSPGHVEFTRNMVTAASRADAAVVLVGVRSGLVEQSRRHLTISALLGVGHLVVAVNKLDLAGYGQDAFEPVAAQVRELAGALGVRSPTVIPVSALEGDNVVERSACMPWYDGPAVLEVLEDLPSATGRTGTARLPRAYAGLIERGVLRAGDEVGTGGHRLSRTRR